MDKLVGFVKSLFKRKSSHGIQEPKQRSWEVPYTTEFTVNPENSFAVNMFTALIAHSRGIDENLAVCPCAIQATLTAILPIVNEQIRMELTKIICSSGRTLDALQASLDAASTNGALNMVNAVFYSDRYQLLSLRKEDLRTVNDSRSCPSGTLSTKMEYLVTSLQNIPKEGINLSKSEDGEAVREAAPPHPQLQLASICQFTGAFERPLFRGGPGTFTCPGSVQKTVDFMFCKYTLGVRYHNVSVTCDNAEENDPQMIILNVEGRQSSVMLLLPPPKSGETIGSLEERLTVERLLRWREKSSELPLHILIPKFRITCSIDLQPVLTAMGMGLLYEEPTAESVDHVLHPSGNGSPIGEFRQQIVLDVSEYGVATSPFRWDRMTPMIAVAGPDFVVDRPFIVIIWNEIANVPLLIARVTDPASSLY
ncbi:plasminogen activator inhibitor 2-like [Paramacrobiotus metropolitanus]|uniref:plasminogen activator inhibitor 2-like n=1 Tax=Paramacrobiotus metropolitanus TaxID=2943436 RepID=UPI0024463940|nr:plasminogen activator inhibitor 2-like [Paramacrobiotus metropolitanus]